MKKYIYKIVPVLFVIFLSCEGDTTEGISRITFFNEIELVGEENYVVEQGTPFVDPGAIASEGDEDVTENIVVSGTVDHTTVGYYPVTYEIENKDGFAKAIVRNVFVLPTNRSMTDVTGTYTGDVSTGTHADACVITDLGDGLFHADDFFGGRYNVGFGYGPAYRLSTFFYIENGDATYVALLTSSPWGPWDVVSPVLAGNTLSHTVMFGSFGFPVQLTKQ